MKFEKLGFFIHPIPLSAVALMALNDHFLKYRFPGFLTGKISDFCGVFYLPIFLLALFVGLALFFEDDETISKFISAPNLISMIVFTDSLLLLVKLSPFALMMIEQIFATYFFRISIIADPTDLWALVMNPLTYFYMRPWLYKSGLEN